MEDAEIDLLRRNVTRFAGEVVRPALHALDHYPDTPLPEGLVGALGDLGLFDLSPSDDVGRALSVALEALALTAAAPAAMLFANAFGRRLVAHAMSDRPPAHGAATGIFAYPIYAEPALVDSAPRLHRDRDALALDGRADLVVNAPVATTLVLPVADEDHDGALALVAIPADTSGVRVEAPLLTLGMRGCPTADVVFEQARLSSQCVIAAPPRAAEIASEVARRLRAPAAAISAGVLGASLRTAAEYANERRQGGCPIIEHQEVRAIVARMVEDRALCRDAVERLSRASIAESDALALFVRAKERAAYATCDGVQLLGGNGYMEDYGQERCMRDAKQAQFLLGRTDVLRQQLTAAFVAERASS